MTVNPLRTSSSADGADGADGSAGQLHSARRGQTKRHGMLILPARVHERKHARVIASIQTSERPKEVGAQPRHQ
jgi:hypothetical protein